MLVPTLDELLPVDPAAEVLFEPEVIEDEAPLAPAVEEDPLSPPLEAVVAEPLDEDVVPPLEAAPTLAPRGSHTSAMQLQPFGQNPPAPQALPVTSTAADGLQPALAAKIASPSRRAAFIGKS